MTKKTDHLEQELQGRDKAELTFAELFFIEDGGSDSVFLRVRHLLERLAISL